VLAYIFEKYNAFSKKSAPIVALIGLYGFCLSLGFSTAGINIFQGFVLVATILFWRNVWSDFKRLPVFWVSLFLAIYIAVHAYFFMHYEPRLAEASNPNWNHFLRVTGLISLPIAWWLMQHFRHYPWLIAVTVVSLAMGVLYNIEPSMLQSHGLGYRAGWGNRLSLLGLMSSLGFITCLGLTTKLLVSDRLKFLRTWALILSLLILMSGFALSLYGSQTRAAWLAALVVMFFFLAHEAWFMVRKRAGRYAVAFIIIGVVGLGWSVVSLDKGGVLDKRVLGEHSTLAAFLDRDVDAVYEANTSIGLRLNMWIVAWEAVAKRPVFGYGVGAMPLLAEHTERHVGSGGHFHNLFVELTVGLGFLGFLGFVVMFSYIVIGSRRLPPDLSTLMLAWAGVIGINLMFSVGVGHPSGRGIMIWFMAICLAGFFIANKKTKHHES